MIQKTFLCHFLSAITPSQPIAAISSELMFFVSKRVNIIDGKSSAESISGVKCSIYSDSGSCATTICLLLLFLYVLSYSSCLFDTQNNFFSSCSDLIPIKLLSLSLIEPMSSNKEKKKTANMF